MLKIAKTLSCGVVNLLTCPRDEQEDFQQEIHIALWMRLARFDKRQSSLRTFLWHVGTNEARRIVTRERAACRARFTVSLESRHHGPARSANTFASGKKHSRPYGNCQATCQNPANGPCADRGGPDPGPGTATIYAHMRRIKVCIAPKTLLRWQQIPEFQAAFRAAKFAAYSQTIGRLHQISNAAVSTLGKVMVDPSTPAATKVRAADSILNHTAKAVEAENFEARLSEVERITEVSKKKQ